MAITAKKGEGFEKELIPAGNYVARCYKMLEIGTVETEYMGEKKNLYKVRIGWELPTELRVFKEKKGEQPLVIDKEYTLSMGEKANLRRDLASWRGKDFSPEESEAFDITVLLGKPCMLNIIHSQGKKDPTKTYQTIAGITPVPKGFTVPAQINPNQLLSYDSFDENLFNSLPDFIKDAIRKTPEFHALTHPEEYKFIENGQPIEVEDDLPF